ncbi:hypothetical protein FB45DRAFT_862260 [Roridomyces roridus]|uniref:Uncharacterized protein n=1 Tax=Roridomyces roridus TaxID=1738132 RepID=A0AAD7C775_9AGAR|nr:hypothetical protein FB45DRAFT_862260 [Roridomyces roridus]
MGGNHNGKTWGKDEVREDVMMWTRVKEEEGRRSSEYSAGSYMPSDVLAAAVVRAGVADEPYWRERERGTGPSAKKGPMARQARALKTNPVERHQRACAPQKRTLRTIWRLRGNGWCTEATSPIAPIPMRKMRPVFPNMPGCAREFELLKRGFCGVRAICWCLRVILPSCEGRDCPGRAEEGFQSRGEARQGRANMCKQYTYFGQSARPRARTINRETVVGRVREGGHGTGKTQWWVMHHG